MRHFFITQIIARNQRGIFSVRKCTFPNTTTLDSNVYSSIPIKLRALTIGRHHPIRPSPFSIPHFLETTHSQ